MPGEAVLRHDLSELTGCELRCRARVFAGRVLGFFLDDAGWTLRYISVALQADPPGATRLLPTATLPPVLNVEGCLHACLAPDELRRGHLLAGSIETVSRDDEQTLHDSLHWLPYWLEPGAPASGTLRDAALAIGAQLSCCGESFGVVEDMLVDTETWAVSALRIAIHGATGAQRLHLPPSFIRHADWDARCFDSDVRAAALACAPTSSLAAPASQYFDRLQQHLSGGRRMS